MKRAGDTRLWTAAVSGSLAVHALVGAALALAPRSEEIAPPETVITIHSTSQETVELTQMPSLPAEAVAAQGVAVSALAIDEHAPVASEEAPAIDGIDAAVLPDAAQLGSTVLEPDARPVGDAAHADAAFDAPAANVEELLAALAEAPARPAVEPATQPESVPLAETRWDAQTAVAPDVRSEVAASAREEQVAEVAAVIAAAEASSPVLALVGPVAEVAGTAASVTPVEVAGSIATGTIAVPAARETASPIIAAEAPSIVGNVRPASDVAVGPGVAATAGVTAPMSSSVATVAVGVTAPSPASASLTERDLSVVPVAPEALPAASPGPAMRIAAVPSPVEVIPAPPASISLDPPQIAAVFRPHGEDLAPLEDPEEMFSRVSVLVAVENAARKNSCFLARPTIHVSDITVTGFAASNDVMREFSSSLAEAIETPPELQPNTVSQPQCAALAFASGLGASAGASMSVELSSKMVESGGELMGVVENIGRRWFYLLVVDGEGIVQEIDASRMSAIGQGAVLFHAPMTLTGQAGDTVQLLLAIASDEILEMVWLKEGYAAGDYFELLGAEISAGGGRADFGIASFSVR